MDVIRVYERIRIDPAGLNGIHLVQEGGERIYVTFKEIPVLIQELKKVYKTIQSSSGNHGGGV